MKRTEARYYTSACLTMQQNQYSNTPDEVICKCEYHVTMTGFVS
jgi:hypothetical protein